MAHVPVVRRSLTPQQWARIQVDRLDELVVDVRDPIADWEVRVGQYRPEGTTWDHDWRPIAEGGHWGRPDGAAEFRATARVPAALDGREVWLEFLTGAEVIVVANGRMADGIDPNRSAARLAARARAGETFELLLTGYTRSVPDDMRHVRTARFRGCVQPFRPPALVAFREDLRALRTDLEVLYAFAWGPAIDGDLREVHQRRMEEALALFPPYDAPAAAWDEAGPRLRDFLATRVYAGGGPVGHRGALALVAHSHLDVAYHWKVAQSIQKNARTCLVQLRLMDRHPEFSYAHTQAWAYESLERHYPALFEEVRRRVAEGRWEIVGAMYVEPDCNVPSAESLARQILVGKRYFLEKFGVECDNAWMPDVFGNSAVLPQLLRLGGVPYFVSNKMSTWNDTNRFPHHHFVWRGLDGSGVFACVPPVHFITWNDPNQLAENWQAFADKDVSDESLQMYGFGDGGSGVTDDMMEWRRRCERLPGLPRLRVTTGREFLHRAFSGDPRRFAVWDGELYLEMHRGTFTSKARLKRENRCGEFLAQETEALCAAASLAGRPYPAAALREAWKRLLLNQFHDILPGSHTEPVYREALDACAEMRAAFGARRAEALDALAPRAAADRVAVFNPLGDARGGVALEDEGDPLPAGTASLVAADGSRCAVQELVSAGGGRRRVAAVPPVEGLGWGALRASPGPAPDAAPGAALRADARGMENAFFRLAFDEGGRLASLFDKRHGREAVAPGAAANEWQLFEDKPGNYNAWDLLRNYADHPIPLAGWDPPEIVERGPLSCALRFRRAFGRSRAEQIVRLWAELPRIDFETWIDWQEEEKLLKAAFPLAIRSAHFTTDTSAGGLERSTLRNTSWEEARFEVCCHKWLDLSGGLFGVALLNDGKYGCDVRDHVARLTLLKAPVRPDPVSDREEHRFTYAVLPHGGDWRRGGVTEAAYDLNAPLRLLGGRAAPAAGPVLRVRGRPVKVLALKGDEDGRGDIVARLAELYGAHADVEIEAGFDFRRVDVCDLLERPREEVRREGRVVRLAFAPFQIRTLRFAR